MPYLSGVSAPVHITHIDDVCDAFAFALEARLHGAYNVATEDPILPSRFPAAAGVRGLPVPWWLLAGAVTLAHRAGIGNMHPTWVTMGASRPIVVSGERLRRAGWTPRYRTTTDAIRAVVDQSRAKQ